MLLQAVYEIAHQFALQFFLRFRNTQFDALRDTQTLVAARVDVGKRGQIHIHIE